MESSYSNITLKGPRAADILQELGDQGRSAFVSPTQDSLSTVYDLDSAEEGSSALMELAANLSEYFGCPALAVQTSDEELFCYWLFTDGQLLDNYQSPAPSMNALASQGGNPDFLIQNFNPDVSAEEIAEILHDPDQDKIFTLAVDRHLALVELLDLPLCAVGYGFCELESGEYPEDLDPDDLLQIDVD